MGLMEARMNETDESASSEIVESRPSKDFTIGSTFLIKDKVSGLQTNLDRVILSVFIRKRFFDNVSGWC